MQRQHKWRWRRHGRRRNTSLKNPPAPASDVESPQIALEREAVRLLREWRETQEAISYRQETPSRQQERIHGAEIVAFGWGTGEGDSEVPATRRLGVDGVRERLRGRGEV
jgi:hypothetical protein